MQANVTQPTSSARRPVPRRPRCATTLAARFSRHFLVCVFALSFGTARSAAADTVTYTYDANGRLTKADYGGGNHLIYTYDRSGNILTVTSSSSDNTLWVSISPVGSGSVSGTGIACPGDCIEAFAGTPALTLTAAAEPGFVSLGWGGTLVTTDNPLDFAMDSDKTLTAYFGAAGGSTDTDGIADTVEMGPGGGNASYDGNGDGVADYQQANVASLPTAAGGGYATLAVPAGLTLANVQAVENPSPGDAPALIVFPFGFFQFTVNGLAAGACTRMTLLLTPKYPALTTYYKYGPEPAALQPHWYEFVPSGATGATVFQDAGRSRVEIDLCDGQRGDSDVTANAAVLDPGGPAERLPTFTPTRTPTRTPTPTPIPACSRVTPIPASGGTFTGTNSGGDTLRGTCGGGGRGPETVFRWVPAASGVATITTCGGSTNFDTVLYMRSADCAAGTQVTCNDDADCDGGSLITPNVTAGQTYFIVVDSYWLGTGTFTLTVTPPGPDGTPDISVSPGQLSFGRVLPNTATSGTVTVRNVGSAPLRIGVVGQGDGLAAPFSVAGDTCSNAQLSPGASCTITVRFAPAAAGTFRDSFAIPSDDPDTNPVTVEVAGSTGGAGAAVPTLGRWLRAALGLALVGGGLSLLRRRRSRQPPASS